MVKKFQMKVKEPTKFLFLLLPLNCFQIKYPARNMDQICLRNMDYFVVRSKFKMNWCVFPGPVNLTGVDLVLLACRST